jgi:hypothetical protein
MAFDFDDNQSLQDHLLARTLSRMGEQHEWSGLSRTDIGKVSDQPAHAVVTPAQCVAVLELTCSDDEVAHLLRPPADAQHYRYIAATTGIQALAYHLREKQAEVARRHYRTRICNALPETPAEAGTSLNARLEWASANIWSGEGAPSELRCIDNHHPRAVAVATMCASYQKVTVSRVEAEVLRRHVQYLQQDLAARASTSNVLSHLPSHYDRQRVLDDLLSEYQAPWLADRTEPVRDQLPRRLAERPYSNTWCLHTSEQDMMNGGQSPDELEYFRVRKNQVVSLQKDQDRTTRAEERLFDEKATAFASQLEAVRPRVQDILSKTHTTRERLGDIQGTFDALQTVVAPERVPTSHTHGFER